MPTVVLDAYSKAFPLISNRIRAAVYSESDLSAPVATIIDSTAGHPARIYHFPGLPRDNYAFSLDEIDGGGIVINNLALFDVVPGAIDGLLTRDDEQIKVGTTTGFNTGLNTVTFDGTGGKPNYIGWTIVPSELTGRGILALGLDYSWDPITGIFSLLQIGDVLAANTYYNIHFDPMINTTGGSVSTITDFSARIVTIDDNILTSDFGATIICEPSGIFMKLYLPDIITVPIGRLLTIETIKALGSVVQCVQIVPDGADNINYLRGSLFMMNNENLQIYRFKRPDTSNEWRVRNADGNFKTVGQSVTDDCVQSGVYCKQLFDGTVGDTTQYARIYNEIVVHLPLTQVCDYDNWATGNNKYLYSLANSADPDNVNKFHFPDRRNLYERNTGSGKAGDFQQQQMEDHKHQIGYEDGIPGGVGGYGRNTGQGNITWGLQSVGIASTRGSTDNPMRQVTADTMSPLRADGSKISGSETRPITYLINKYVLI